MWLMMSMNQNQWREFLETPIASMIEDVRTINALEERGILYVEHLQHLNDDDIVDINNLGDRGLQIVKDSLKARYEEVLNDGSA